MDRLAEVTTVYASNRAGLGLSDPRPAPHGSSSAVDDLPRRARGSTPGVAIRDCGRLVRRPRRPIVRPSFPRPSGRRRAHRCNRTRLGSTARGDHYAHSGRRPSGNPERRGHDQRTHPRQRGSGGRRAPVPTTPLVVIRHGIPFPGGPDWPTDNVEALWTSLQEGLAQLSPKSAVLVAADSGRRIIRANPTLWSMPYAPRSTQRAGRRRSSLRRPSAAKPPRRCPEHSTVT